MKVIEMETSILFCSSSVNENCILMLGLTPIYLLPAIFLRWADWSWPETMNSFACPRRLDGLDKIDTVIGCLYPPSSPLPYEA